MKNPGMKHGAELCVGRSAGLIVAGLLAAGALSGWGISATFGTRAAAIEAPFELTRNRDMATIEGAKANLVGSYLVTGTDSDGKPYVGTHILDVSMAPPAPWSSIGTTGSRSASARSSAMFLRSPA